MCLLSSAAGLETILYQQNGKNVQPSSPMYMKDVIQCIIKYNILTPHITYTLLYFSSCGVFATLSSSSVMTVFSESVSDCFA